VKRALVVALAATVALVVAEEEIGPFERGLELFRRGRYEEALRQFEAAEALAPGDPLGGYNSLTCRAAAGALEEAESVLTATFDELGRRPAIRARAAYNLGTAYLRLADEAARDGALASRQGELHAAIRWLRQSLLDVPEDRDAKSNLEYANRLLEELESQQQQEGQGEGDSGDDEREQDQEGEGEGDRDRQGDQDGEGEGEGEGRDSQQDESQRQQSGRREDGRAEDRQAESREIPEEVARNLLRAARDAELRALRLLREQRNRRDAARRRPLRDW